MEFGSGRRTGGSGTGRPDPAAGRIQPRILVIIIKVFIPLSAYRYLFIFPIHREENIIGKMQEIAAWKVT